MKLYLVLFVSFFSVFMFAQNNTQFGVKGGLSFTFFNETEANFGFEQKTDIEVFGGVFLDIKVNSEFHLQPEILYVGLGDFEFLNAPIYAKYDVSENLTFAAGPSLIYFFDLFANRFKVRADVNTAFRITKAMDINLKYTIGFEELSPDVLFLGIGYRL